MIVAKLVVGKRIQKKRIYEKEATYVRYASIWSEDLAFYKKLFKEGRYSWIGEPVLTIHNTDTGLTKEFR